MAAGPDAPDGATTALPEVRALLAEVATRIDQAAAGIGGTAGDPVLAGLRDTLAAIGLLSAGGATGTAAAAGTALGIDPVTLDRLVLDPGGVAAAVRADTTRRPALAAALRALAGDTRTATAAGETVALSFASGLSAVTATFDLAAGGTQVTASGPDGAGWGLTAAISRSVTGAAVGVNPAPNRNRPARPGRPRRPQRKAPPSCSARAPAAVQPGPPGPAPGGGAVGSLRPHLVAGAGPGRGHRCAGGHGAGGPADRGAGRAAVPPDRRDRRQCGRGRAHRRRG